MVYEAVQKNRPTEIERARIEVRLQNIDDRLLKKSRDYNGEQPWVENALTQHENAPFHAVITLIKQPNTETVLVANEVDETNLHWNIPTQVTAARVAQDLAIAVSPLLQSAEEIIFVDPHFDPDVRRFRRPLEKFLEQALFQNSRLRRIEYHFKDGYNKPNFDNDFKRLCQQKIAPLIPIGSEIKLVRWKERARGEDFHARYILTDKGGVLIDKGLDDDDDDGGQTTPVVLLKPNIYAKVWKDFQKFVDLMQCTYEFDNEITITGIKH